ncbi:lipopolysaccharide biosynthesis protein [Vibrio mexicanus]|uniref:lipopolysaccharide biosynthesis protein n=1 Tax=Vibrio mexicanus TaxID=1004326 RepID=UPI00063CCF9C|nr:oligosaccharide flippase family protein [Vibrio mexicanus]
MNLQKLKPFKSMLTYGISLFLVKGLSLIMLPFIARYLTPTQLGQLELLATTTAFFSLLVGLAMHESLYRFVGIVTNRNDKHRKASELYYACLFTSLILTLALILIVKSIDASSVGLNHYQLLLVAVVLCFESALAISLAWIRMQDKASTFFKLSVVSALLQVMFVVVIVLHQPSVTLIFAAGVVVSFCQFLVLHFVNQFSFVLPKPSQLGQYVKYSVPLMLSALVAFGLSGAERWIIAYATSLETLGLYAIAAKFALAMCILVQPFGMWWMPKRFNTLNTQGPIAASKVTQYGMVYISLLGVAVGIGGQIFIQLALPDVYAGAATLLTLTIPLVLFKELTELVNIGLLNSKQTRTIFNINLACTFGGLALCYVLLPHGIVGIVGALMLAQLTKLLLVYYYSQKRTRLPYQVKSLCLVVLIPLAALGLSLHLNSLLGLVMLGFSATILIIVISSMLSLVPFKIRDIAQSINRFSLKLKILKLTPRAQTKG